MDKDMRLQYWVGWKNKVYRYWFYIKQGNGVINEFRNLFLIILGTVFTFKQDFPILKDLRFLSIIFGVCFLALFITGYYFTHKVNKVIDWLSIEFSTHWGRYGYFLQEKQNTLLEEILKNFKLSENGLPLKQVIVSHVLPVIVSQYQNVPIAEASKLINIDPKKYVWHTHYPVFCALLAEKMADEMIQGINHE